MIYDSDGLSSVTMGGATASTSSGNLTGVSLVNIMPTDTYCPICQDKMYQSHTSLLMKCRRCGFRIHTGIDYSSPKGTNIYGDTYTTLPYIDGSATPSMVDDGTIIKENKMEFKIGDRVIVKDSYYESFAHNKKGTVKHFVAGDIGIEFDERISRGHDLSGNINSSNGWYVPPSDVEKIIEDTPYVTDNVSYATRGDRATPKENNTKMKIKIGVLYEPKAVCERKCGSWSMREDEGKHPRYIRYTSDRYDILNGSLEKLDSCYACFESFDLQEVSSVDREVTKLKAGDKVKVIKDTCLHGIPLGETVTLREIYETDSQGVKWYMHEYLGTYILESNIELINSTPVEETKTEMELQPLTALSNLIQRTFSEDTKSLYQAGYLTKDLNITEKLTTAVGEMFVGHIIDGSIDKQDFGTFAKELIARAKDEIAEVQKSKK